MPRPHSTVSIVSSDPYLTTPTYPGGATETRGYDIAGNLLTFKNRAGAMQTFAYDVRNREKNNSWSTGSPQTRTLIYDDASRVTACDTISTHILFTCYKDNLLNSQEEWTSYFGDNVHHIGSYTYNADGNRASVGFPGLTLNYGYTSRNQISTVTNAGNGIVYGSYLYDKNGDMTTRTLNNSVGSSFAYDALNRVTSITHPFANGSRSLSYGYDEVSNRISEQRNGVAFASIGYDNNSEMTSYSQSGVSTSLTYDASGNRKSVGSTSYGAANTLNQYTTVGGAALSYGGNGNLKTYNGWTYTYDSMNRLTVASGPGGVTANFYYDGLNRQVARTISGSPTTFSVWDGWTLYAEYTAGNILDNLPIHGAGADLIEQSEAGLPTTFIYPDGVGSTAYVADSAGNLIEKYTYDLAGTPTVYDPNGVIRPVERFTT